MQTSCAGCSAALTRADPFPIMAVLLNALHKGITVRILTVNYNEPDCASCISALPFLALNGCVQRAWTKLDLTAFVAVPRSITTPPPPSTIRNTCKFPYVSVCPPLTLWQVRRWQDCQHLLHQLLQDQLHVQPRGRYGNSSSA